MQDHPAGCIMIIMTICTVCCAGGSASGCIRQPWRAGCTLAGPYTRYTPMGALSMKARWAMLVSSSCASTIWVCQASCSSQQSYQTLCVGCLLLLLLAEHKGDAVNPAVIFSRSGRHELRQSQAPCLRTPYRRCQSFRDYGRAWHTLWSEAKC